MTYEYQKFKSVIIYSSAMPFSNNFNKITLTIYNKTENVNIFQIYIFFIVYSNYSESNCSCVILIR